MMLFLVFQQDPLTAHWFVSQIPPWARPCSFVTDCVAGGPWCRHPLHACLSSYDSHCPIEYTLWPVALIHRGVVVVGVKRVETNAVVGVTRTRLASVAPQSWRERNDGRQKHQRAQQHKLLDGVHLQLISTTRRTAASLMYDGRYERLLRYTFLGSPWPCIWRDVTDNASTTSLPSSQDPTYINSCIPSCL